MLQVKIQIVEEVASVDDFLRLRKISGLSERPLEAAIKALPRSLYGVHIIIDGAVIGMGRIVGDGALNFLRVWILLSILSTKNKGLVALLWNISWHISIRKRPQVVISRLWLMFLHYMKNLVLP